MEEELRSLWTQITFGSKLNIFPNSGKFNNIVIFGMGGSGIAGSIFQELYSDMPVISINDYKVPNFVGKSTLAIGISYSGNTIETVTALDECIDAGAKVVSITSGGVLSQEKYDPLIIPSGLQPRSAIGYLLIPLINTFMSFAPSEYKEAASVTRNLDNNNREIMDLAESMVKNRQIPFIYGFTPFRSLAYRWKTQFNENSKIFAYSGFFPEMDHNDIIPMKSTYRKEEFKFLVFGAENNRFISERISATADLTDSQFTIIEPRGNSILSKLFYLIHYGDYLSYYVAKARGIDPKEVEVITQLKKMIR
ncbi:MAG: bifunctional phosphoglucose/phosphomannose isomerase [Thermoplasmataceae archaeon]